MTQKRKRPFYTLPLASNVFSPEANQTVDATDPVKFKSASWTAGRYTTCKAYKASGILTVGVLPTSTLNAFSHHTVTTYDGNQRLLTTNVLDPNGLNTSTAYSYDASGNVTSTVSKNANGKAITDVSGSRTLGSSYDLLERVGCIQDAAPIISATGACSSEANPLVQNTYDNGSNQLGRLTQAVSSIRSPDGLVGTVTENMTYDLRGRTTSNQLQISATGGGFTLPTLPTYLENLTYNTADQPVTTTTTVEGSAGYSFTNLYDSTTGLLTGLGTSPSAANIATLSYNEHALIAGITYKDSAGNLLATQSSTNWTSLGTIYSDGISFDAVGNIISLVTSHASISGLSGSGGNETQNFCYDELNQLT